MATEIEGLKKSLIELYEAYCKENSAGIIKDLAGEIYNKFKDLDPVLDKDTALALRSLVDVAFDTGVKLDKSKAKEILATLK